LLRLTVDLWNSSMEVESQLVDNISGRLRPLRILYDTGAYMTVIDSGTLLRAGYNVHMGKDAGLDVVGCRGIPAKEILLRGLELGGKNDIRIPLGPVLVYATDMSDTNAAAVLGLNVITVSLSAPLSIRTRFANPVLVRGTPNPVLAWVCDAGISLCSATPVLVCAVRSRFSPEVGIPGLRRRFWSVCGSNA